MSLRTEHAAVFAQFAPLIPKHQELAAKLVDIQRRMFLQELEMGQGAKLRELPRILTFNVRQSLPEFDAMLAELDAKKIVVTEVIYDPARGELLLFGQP